MDIGLNSKTPSPQEATHEQDTTSQRTDINATSFNRKVNGTAYAPYGHVMAYNSYDTSTGKTLSLTECYPKHHNQVLCYVNKFKMNGCNEVVESNSTTQPSTIQLQQSIQTVANPETVASNSTFRSAVEPMTASTQVTINYDECQQVLKDLQTRAAQPISSQTTHHTQQIGNNGTVMSYTRPAAAAFRDGPARLNWKPEFINQQSTTENDNLYISEATKLHDLFNCLCELAKNNQIDDQLKSVVCHYTIKLFNTFYDSVDQITQSKALSLSQQFVIAAENTVLAQKLQNKEQKVAQLFEEITGGQIQDLTQLNRFGNRRRGNDRRPILDPLPCTVEKGWEIFLRDHCIEESNIGTYWWLNATDPEKLNEMIQSRRLLGFTDVYPGEVPQT